MLIAEMSTAKPERSRPGQPGRPRGFEIESVVKAAGDLFWERGYEMTSIGDLEEKTGLDRSSLYHAFGSKHALFEAALGSYLAQNIEARLGAMRQADASLATVVGFFAGMAQGFRSEPLAARGCLMVNAVGELGSHDRQVVRAAAGYRDSFREAFRAALGQAAAKREVDDGQTRARAELLTATTVGLFLLARIDRADAAEVCERVAAEVSSWSLQGHKQDSARRRRERRP